MDRPKLRLRLVTRNQTIQQSSNGNSRPPSTRPWKSGGDFQSPKARKRYAEQQEIIVNMRLKGAQFSEIAAATGLNRDTCHKRFWTYLKSMPTEDAVNMRKEMSEHLRMIKYNLWKEFRNHPARVAEVMVKVEDRFARLNGLDMPIKTELSGPDGGPVPLSLDILANLRTRYEAAIAQEKPAIAIMAKSQVWLPARPMTTV